LRSGGASVSDPRLRYLPDDEERLDANDSEQVNRWCLALGLRPANLAKIVDRVGNRASAVKGFVAAKNALQRGDFDDPDDVA
jgi:hypothetical protein